MEIYCFASQSVTNIWAGIGASMWAVNRTSDSDMKSRITKSKKMKVGSLGLLYCNDTHAFTTPFITFSTPDLNKVESNVWSGEWVLPFKIHPLGTPRKQIHKDIAKERWQVLIDSRNNISATMNLTGTTVFVPKEISSDDWEKILSELME